MPSREAYGAVGDVRPIGAMRGPYRGRGPAGFQRSDDRIRELACEALADDEHIDATHIEVTVADGIVTLAGAVADRPTKRRAEEVIDLIGGIRDIHNQLELIYDGRSNRSGRGGVGDREP